MTSTKTAPGGQAPLRGIMLMLGSVLLFSVMQVLIKMVSDHLPVGEVVFFRNVVGLVPVLLTVFLNGGVRELHTDRIGGHITRALIGVTAMTCMFWAIELLPLANATALNFTAPLFLTALSVPLLGEKVGVFRWGAVLVGFIGTVIMVNPSTEAVIELGTLVALAGALFQALAMVAVSQLSRTESSTVIVFHFTVISTVLSAQPLPWFWVTPDGWDDWLTLIGVGLFGGCAQILLTQAYAHAQAVVIAPFNYSSLLWAGLFGYVLWDQVPDQRTVIGAALVAASGVFIVHREARRRRAARQALRQTPSAPNE